MESFDNLNYLLLILAKDLYFETQLKFKFA
jgi:hypothetical protein